MPTRYKSMDLFNGGKFVSIQTSVHGVENGFGYWKNEMCLIKRRTLGDKNKTTSPFRTLRESISHMYQRDDLSRC
jgi:hypothetical protein